MSKTYGVALIGCGVMGEAHMNKIYDKQNIRVRCVCDINIDRAERFAKKYHAEKAETDYRKIMEDKEVDIVIIATYPSLHLDILTQCIQHKKHVLCEKPIAENYENGEKIYKLVKENPEVKVLVGYILRHNKTYQKVAEMIRSGAIGFPIIMRMVQNHHTMDWQKYLNLIRDPSPIVDCGVHYIDVMRWFTGAEVTDVIAMGQRTESDVPVGKYNYGMMQVKLSDGSIGYYEAGWGNTMSSDNIKEFVGPKGRIRIAYQYNRHEHQEEGDLIEYYTYPDKKYEIINNLCDRKPTDVQLAALIDMIENNTSGNPTIEEVFTSFQIALQADAIIKRGL